jgi:tetratricopeptide (TPR) repeat protein
MNPPPFTNTRRAITLWALLLVTGFVFIEVFNLACMRYARDIREKDYRTYLAEAAKRMAQFDLPGAMTHVDEAKRRGPKAAEPDAMAGHIQYQLKHWEQAIIEYKSAIAKGTQEEGVFLNTVWALIELRRYDEAAEIGARALLEGIATPALPRYIAEAYFRSGNMAEAIPYFERALEGYPNDLYLLDHLRQAYRATKQLDKAEAMRARIADVEASLTAPVTPTSSSQ